MNHSLLNIVTLICTASLAIILISMSAALVYGLFNNDVNNGEIFKLLNPAFNTIVGGFIGLVTGIKIGNKNGGN